MYKIHDELLKIILKYVICEVEYCSWSDQKETPRTNSTGIQITYSSAIRLWKSTITHLLHNIYYIVLTKIIQEDLVLIVLVQKMSIHSINFMWFKTFLYTRGLDFILFVLRSR